MHRSRQNFTASRSPFRRRSWDNECKRRCSRERWRRAATTNAVVGCATDLRRYIAWIGAGCQSTARGSGRGGLALGARGGIEVPIAGPFVFRADLNVVIPLFHNYLEVNGTQIWSASPVAAWLAIGVGAQFP